MSGITAYGAYIPRTRLQKSAIADANDWFDASLRGLAKGERSVCNWDEDTLTMAVEAGQDCLSVLDAGSVNTLYLASTTLPFLDRQNSVVVSQALNLGDDLRTMDVAASQRAGTSALIAMLESGLTPGNALLVASEHRRSKCGSRAEMLWGDGGAAVSVGNEGVIADHLGSETYVTDFVDHYRGEDSTIDYEWEERWIREEGYMKSVPLVVSRLLDKAGVKPSDIAHFVLACDQARTPGAVARKIGISADAVIDNHIEDLGVTGVAHPILLLTEALEKAKTGDLILLTGFGQGADAVLLRATDALAGKRPETGFTGALARRREDANYNKFLNFNNLVDREVGKRGELDKQSYLAAMYRRKDLLTGFIGGKCRSCGTVQIPKEKYCVNPECGALDSQDDHPMSAVKGRVMTWTADRLTFDWNPPAYFGLVEFEGGGRLMMDFTEVESGTMDTGVEVSVHFRIRQFDNQRGFRKYFWKATPAQQ
ncbi:MULTISPECIES: 3-oxoacyl-[acyl-carrier-protein] synthase III C-terminal domain-containing protein [Marinobacter]|jgi:3-hydroxy-3-methylglutaryl CoA synthase|uniref:3-oxoacyl-[acyl-carrier-protein] synthase III C-terminal domain-containing protein n=1 Tax=Marinobacter TaxID=2742 RepID=UPI001BCC8E3C|nr:3-oxoacyl-[acyl-carrier-protein] synthase III C-terminal domain-containing protein [Marinobacter salarius]MBS8232588.1 3-hydroxy-3-methylglutaryl CoA synthase [Marinobacter salarius]WOI17945.1 3-oxoacyl-[acyl-carrier-protein] synthase III C-terminal domain-containing protein [Marinobacter salarius]